MYFDLFCCLFWICRSMKHSVCVCDVYLVWITAVVNLLLLQALDELMASRNWRIFLVFIQVENIF